MYRLYYSYGDGETNFVDFFTVEAIQNYIASNSWRSSSGICPFTTIRRERFYPKKITKFVEREIANQDNPLIVNAIEDGKKTLEEKLKPLMEEERKRQEDVERAQLEYLKNIYEKNINKA
jgi:hypothetical protein